MTLTQARIAFLSATWREAIVVDASVQTPHPGAPQVVDESQLITYDDAYAEAVRRQILKGVKRDRLTLSVKLTPTTAAIDLGDVIQLTNPRFGLSGGKSFVVITSEPDAKAGELLLGVWG